MDDIDISNFKMVDKKVLDQINTEFYLKYDSIPEQFNWAISTHSDTPEIQSKKRLISPVKNQYLCGCCWAISSATAISDCYVVKGLVDWSPNISYTYALSRYPQLKCSGGSARILLEQIKNGDGITSDQCIDESWCLNNSKCTTSDASEHFKTSNKAYLSSLIPDVGCYDGKKLHHIYTIDDVYSLTVSENLEVFEAQIKIKQHIMIRGPVVGGFLIMKNFVSGEFTKTGNGIYFENGEYNPAKDYVYSFEKDNILGSHSVVILGWGIERNISFSGIKSNIPYWFCRNSWGRHWGSNGYFKIAMYPFNKICQFSKKVRVLHNSKIKEVGGVTAFNVIKPPFLRKMNELDNKYKLLRQESSFVSDKSFIPIVVCITVIILMVT